MVVSRSWTSQRHGTNLRCQLIWWYMEQAMSRWTNASDSIRFHSNFSKMSVLGLFVFLCHVRCESKWNKFPSLQATNALMGISIFSTDQKQTSIWLGKKNDSSVLCVKLGPENPDKPYWSLEKTRRKKDSRRKRRRGLRSLLLSLYVTYTAVAAWVISLSLSPSLSVLRLERKAWSILIVTWRRQATNEYAPPPLPPLLSLYISSSLDSK